MLSERKTFDELQFFAQIKHRPSAFLGKPSLISLRDQLFGMEYAFSFYTQESPLKYFNLFVKWYYKEKLKDLNGYACWWNNILYTSGNDDAYALESFFACFEQFLSEEHNLYLPKLQ
ncbi:MAG: hypothetical protein IJ370_00965 [Oscillospiraceae bacterium]|nr:hypothetical protein [Oscillospiraceae bacterium]